LSKLAHGAISRFFFQARIWESVVTENRYRAKESLAVGLSVVVLMKVPGVETPASTLAIPVVARTIVRLLRIPGAYLHGRPGRYRSDGP
jgi:hypothetical protein